MNNAELQEDLAQVFGEISERDVTGHDKAIDRAVRILEDVVQKIDDGDDPE